MPYFSKKHKEKATKNQTVPTKAPSFRHITNFSLTRLLPCNYIYKIALIN